MVFKVKDLKKILRDLDDELPVVLDVKYDERYVLTDISTYEDEVTPKELVIEAGYSHEICKSVLGDYANDIERIFVDYFNNQTNIVTPIPYSYIKWDIGDVTLLVEKSMNLNETIFGATILEYIDGSVQRIDLSENFSSEKEVEEYLKSLTPEKVKMADRYGEVKECGVEKWKIDML